MATKENDVLRYVHQYHLTGTSLMTDSSGAQIDTTMKYLPFGETLTGSVPTDKKFTGQRLDATGLYYYNARYYDATIGRFISPDTITATGPLPLGQKIACLTVSYTGVQIDYHQKQQLSYLNPQEHNRYSYALNNPLKYTDPDGHWAFVVIPFTNPAVWGGLIAAIGTVWGTVSGAVSNAWESICDAVSSFREWAGRAGVPDEYNYVTGKVTIKKNIVFLNVEDLGGDAQFANSGEPANPDPQQGPGRAPKNGLPNSIYEQIDNNGQVVSRTSYNEAGKPDIRYDFSGHTHGNILGPHQHIFMYNNNGQFIGINVKPLIIDP